MKRFTARLVGLFAVAAVVAGSTPARAERFIAPQYRLNLDRDACQAAERIADFLVQNQISGPAGRTGWSWVIGQDRHAINMAGLVSLALLDAYEILHKASYLRAARSHADSLLSRPPGGLPLKADVEVLMRLSGYFADSGYGEAAGRMFERIRRRSPDGEAEVARIAAGRRNHPCLLGYDVALAIRAARSVDERRYAYELADAVMARLAAWYHLRRDPRFSLISAAALTGALEALDAAHYSRAIHRFRADLMMFQRESGTWLHNETQLSAQASAALLNSPLDAERRAGLNGAHWLGSTLLTSGAMASFNDYMPEPFVGQVYSGVNADALMALSAACALERL